MRDEREVFGQQLKLALLLGRRVEVVIGSDFEEVHAVAVKKDVAAQRLAEPEPDAERGQPREN